jgi:hypothetical protein
MWAWEIPMRRASPRSVSSPFRTRSTSSVRREISKSSIVMSAPGRPRLGGNSYLKYTSPKIRIQNKIIRLFEKNNSAPESAVSH